MPNKNLNANRENTKLRSVPKKKQRWAYCALCASRAKISLIGLRNERICVDCVTPYLRGL